ncbi:hypothetical protein FRC02_001255 [Tulasnella sp. 418]|nr:hypothetical protein FRC02_001255 [Tulasnella sp. 418]
MAEFTQRPGISGMFPVELYGAIIEQVTQKSDLCSLARTSSTFQLLAEPFIYHSLSSKSYPKFLKAAKSTISCPRRHRLVKDINLTLPTPTPTHAFRHSSIARLVERLLMVVSQLKSLGLRGFHVPRWILKRCNHPILEYLDIGIMQHASASVTARNQKDTLQYIQRHTSIVKLMLYVGTSLPIPWDGSHLPHLETLYYAGYARDPHVFLKDRHLKIVFMELFDSLDSRMVNETLSSLSSMGSTLQVLDLSNSYLGPRSGYTGQVMQRFVEALPLLRYLALPSNESDPYDEEDLTHILQKSSRNLIIFRLESDCLVPDIPGLIFKLFAARESLRWIMLTAVLDVESMPYGVYSKENPSIAVDESELWNTWWDLGISGWMM